MVFFARSATLAKSAKLAAGKLMETTGTRPQRDRHDYITRVVAIISAIIAIFALGLTSYQISTIRDNAKRQLRAYIGLVAPTDNQVANAFLPPAKPLIRLVPKNFGLTARL
jgi:hypothetical protein